MSKFNIENIVIRFLLSVILSLPISGFIFGFIFAEDCSWWNILGRAFIGCVMALLTTITLGYPPKNEGGVGEPFEVLPYTIITGIIIFLITSPRKSIFKGEDFR